MGSSFFLLNKVLILTTGSQTWTKIYVLLLQHTQNRLLTHITFFFIILAISVLWYQQDTFSSWFIFRFQMTKVDRQTFRMTFAVYDVTKYIPGLKRRFQLPTWRAKLHYFCPLKDSMINKSCFSMNFQDQINTLSCTKFISDHWLTDDRMFFFFVFFKA